MAEEIKLPDGWVLVDRGALNMVINALRRDAEEGRQVRGEMADMLSAAPAAPQPAQQPLTDEQIKRIMLDNGFTIKEGLTDLKPYVYAAARALIAAAAPQPSHQPLTDEQIYGMHRLNLGIRAGTRNRSKDMESVINQAAMNCAHEMLSCVRKELSD
jgi:hypothetical protein